LYILENAKHNNAIEDILSKYLLNFVKLLKNENNMIIKKTKEDKITPISNFILKFV